MYLVKQNTQKKKTTTTTCQGMRFKRNYILEFKTKNN